MNKISKVLQSIIIHLISTIDISIIFSINARAICTLTAKISKDKITRTGRGQKQYENVESVGIITEEI